jgi:hypothetical protein
MLTLDRITLFYHDLREASRAQSDDSLDDVADWAANVAPTSKQGKTRRAGATSRSHAASARSKRTRSSTTTVSCNRSALGGNIGVKVTEDSEGETGGLSDHDETRGEECEEARNSPVKGNVRVSSSVSRHTLVVWHRLTWCIGSGVG